MELTIEPFPLGRAGHTPREINERHGSGQRQKGKQSWCEKLHFVF